jgi:hypothetical protein
MDIAAFLSYFSLALFLFVMYLHYQHVKNKLLAARREREIAFLQQMSRQFKPQLLAKPHKVTTVEPTTPVVEYDENTHPSTRRNIKSS